jgi:DHA1 family vesicular acetylcholine transporter-like MFS transporter 3
VIGVYATVKLLRRFPQSPWLLAMIGLAMEGLSCSFLPFMKSVSLLIIPLSTICFGIALVDTSLLPMLGYLVDTRHVSVYGSVYAIADISYSLAYAFGPIIAGSVVHNMGFTVLNIIICVLNIAYLPMLYMLRKVYAYEQLNGQTNAVDGQTASANNGTITQPTLNQNYAIDAEKPAESSTYGGYRDAYQNAVPQPATANAYDPLNPQW